MIGKGAFGKVYCVKFLDSNQYFALKVQSREIGVVEGFVNSCIDNESRILSKLSHPNIVKLHQSFTKKRFNFMLLELIEGINLQTLLRRNKHLDRQLVKDVCWQLLDVLEYMHERGVVYCDLKPENIMLKSSGQIKLLDFGNAIDIEDDSLIYEKQTKGTLDYVAPECILGSGTLPRTSGNIRS